MCMENWGRELAIRASDGRSARASEKVGRIITKKKSMLFLARLRFLSCKIKTKEETVAKIFQLSEKVFTHYTLQYSMLYMYSVIISPKISSNPIISADLFKTPPTHLWQL